MVIIKSENQLPESVKAVMAIVALCLAIVIFVKSTIARLKNLGMSAHFLLFPQVREFLAPERVLMFREGAPESAGIRRRHDRSGGVSRVSRNRDYAESRAAL
jgi:hypothetical protein